MPVTPPKGDYLHRMKTIDPTVICINEATKRAVRELHIGIINMMPDTALKKTETQFTMPLHYASGGLFIVPHFIALDGVDRNKKTQQYVDENYITFDQAKENGLDGLIITGANIADPDLRKATFYEPLSDVINWAESDLGPTSTLYSCLASHAYMLIKYGEERTPLQEKRWGVFEHKVRNETHPLTHGMDTVFDIPHSRWNEITEDQFTKYGMPILIASEEAGVHMATSPDGLRSVFWQGHPEYNTNTLLGEFQRDLGISAERRASAEQTPLAPLPKNYFHGKGLSLIEDFRNKVEAGLYHNTEHKGHLPPEIFADIIESTPNRWSSAKRALLSNWIAAIIDKTHEERGKPFMDGVDQDNVFNL
ncbi:MAG: homoserine O-succinyltransferase [Alphaproteobacteria bacterium]|nr:MAG: homoserine O-succinyltransferase [Alphaproteobacteria bacterium]